MVRREQGRNRERVKRVWGELEAATIWNQESCGLRSKEKKIRRKREEKQERVLVFSIDPRLLSFLQIYL